MFSKQLFNKKGYFVFSTSPTEPPFYAVLQHTYVSSRAFHAVQFIEVL